MFKMNWIPDLTIAAAWLIFLATYAVVALGKIPVYRIDRAGAALLGASMMIATGVLLLDEAYARSILVEAAAIVEHCSVATKIP